MFDQDLLHARLRPLEQGTPRGYGELEVREIVAIRIYAPFDVASPSKTAPSSPQLLPLSKSPSHEQHLFTPQKHEARLLGFFHDDIDRRKRVGDKTDPCLSSI
jgi:hypothetical protein